MLPELIQRAREFLSGRSKAYRMVFAGPRGEEVLRDLAKFCRAHDSTFHADERVAGRLDGRREVWLRIQHNLRLRDDDLWKLYGRTDLERGPQQ